MQLTPEVWLSLGQAHRAGGRTERPGAVQAITGQSRQAGAVRGWGSEEEPGVAPFTGALSCLPCSSSAPHSVHIFFDVPGEIIIIDVCDVMNIKSPRC